MGDWKRKTVFVVKIACWICMSNLCRFILQASLPYWTWWYTWSLQTCFKSCVSWQGSIWSSKHSMVYLHFYLCNANYVACFVFLLKPCFTYQQGCFTYGYEKAYWRLDTRRNQKSFQRWNAYANNNGRFWNGFKESFKVSLCCGHWKIWEMDIWIWIMLSLPTVGNLPQIFKQFHK